jgi:transposase
MDADSLSHLDKPELIALVLTLAEQNRVLREHIARLEARVAELEARLSPPGAPPKTPQNSSLPPSSAHKANRPERAKKRRKGRPGRARRLCPNPDHVRAVYAKACRRCGIGLEPADQPEVAAAYDHIDLPPIRPVTTRVHLHGGDCPGCGKHVVAAAPADMPQGSPFGPNIVALVVYLRTRQMVSYARLVEMLRDLFGLTLSQGAIANLLQRAAKPFAAEAERIAVRVRQAKVVHSDETSARVKGRNWWQWVFGSAEAVSHRIAPTRGAVVVEEFLAGCRPEVWVSDRYGAQAGHAERQQVCLAHLLRDVEYAIGCGDSLFAPAMRHTLKRACAIGRQRAELSDDALAAHKRDLEGRVLCFLARPSDSEAGRKLQAAIERWRKTLFVFLERRDVPPTNNVSERALRPSVIYRKVTNGFRSHWGAGAYADACSILATGQLAGQSALDAFRAALAGRSLLSPA